MKVPPHIKDRPACLDAWRETFGVAPPKHLSTPFMMRAIAFEEQCLAEGRISKQILRRLKPAVGDRPTRHPSASALKPGAHLIREWNARTYQIEVTAKGFMMDGQTYKSLTAIARKITGAHWSGPRFFGLAS